MNITITLVILFANATTVGNDCAGEFDLAPVGGYVDQSCASVETSPGSNQPHTGNLAVKIGADQYQSCSLIDATLVEDNLTIYAECPQYLQLAGQKRK